MLDLSGLNVYINAYWLEGGGGGDDDEGRGRRA